MKRHPGLIDFSKDHHQGLITAQVLKQAVRDYAGMPTTAEGKRLYFLDFYKNHLHQHFLLEEEILIPAVRGHDEALDQLCNQVIREHRQLEAFRNRLEKGVDNLGEALNETGLLLEAHIRFEERQLFEMIQAKCPEETLQQIRQKLEEAHRL